MSAVDAHAKRRAREAALQMLYQCEIGKAGAYESIATYWPAREGDEDLPAPLREFANGVVRGTLDRQEEIDRMLQAHAQNWRIERMNVIDRLVLRMSVYEMLTWKAGAFSFNAMEVDMDDTVQSSTTHLLMEGARRIDEANR